MTGYGPEERRLLETAASRVYAHAVTQGYLSSDDPTVSEDPAVRAGFDLLVDIGLLTLDESTGRYLPEDPATVQSRIVVPLGQQGADLLNESARWAETFAGLGQAFRKSPRSASRPVTEIHGLSNINSFIQATLADARSELLTAQPFGRRPADTLADVIDRDVQTLKRGVHMRTLYQHSARHSPVTREYVEQVTAQGAEVRTLDEFFKRLIVVDRQVAIIPGAESYAVAVAIHDKSLISYLVDIFDRSWERAQPFLSKDDKSDRNIAQDVRALTIRLLIEGHSDSASAKRLGVSTRTYAGYIASLKTEYGVDTRFQLGYAMGQKAGRPSNDPSDIQEDVDSEHVDTP